MNRMVMKHHSVESLVENVFTLHLKACDPTKIKIKIQIFMVLSDES
jgi:hypothetical protein